MFTAAILISCNNNPFKGKVFKSKIGYTVVFNSNGTAFVSGGGNAATYDLIIKGNSLELIHPYSESKLTGQLSSDGNSLIIDPGSLIFQKQ